MRYAEIIAESQEHFPRLWLGPLGEVIDLDEDGDSHSAYIVHNEDVFGIGDQTMADATNNDDDLNYDLLIAAAEARGWVRISRDAGGNNGQAVAISARDARGIAYGLRWLEKNAFVVRMLQAEVETLSGTSVNRRYFQLSGEALERFRRRG